MKKIFILFTFAIIACFTAQAELSQKAINMRSQLKSYISSMGLVPSIDSDGDIAFKYEGGSYYVHFQDYKDVVAVSVVKEFSNDSGLSNYSLKQICQSLMSDYAMVKVYPTASFGAIRVEVEALFSTSAQLKQFFSPNLMIVSIVSDELLERV